MNLPLNTAAERKKYTWSYKLKYTFYMLLVSFSIVISYNLVLELYNTSTISKHSFLTLFRANFYFSNINNTIFPHIIFYMLFEELAFRKSLVISVQNLILSLPLLLYLSFKDFMNDSFYLFIYSFYALLLIIIYKKEISAKWTQSINIIISLLALAVFHISKFSTDNTNFVELFFNNMIPILIIGTVLAHLRLKFNSYWSFALYFVLIILVNIF